MKKVHLVIQLAVLLSLMFCIEIQAQSRRVIDLPDISGYVTLKCDFHLHTMFSDGDVWPAFRMEEAWVEGLDAIAITDHIEYVPHKDDINLDFNRSYEIAAATPYSKQVICIRGAEITRNMPPGHLNALFITDANLLKTENYLDAIKNAAQQGAFIFWNHPGWKAQQPDTTIWFSEHTSLYQQGFLRGIEVVNSNEYYPIALQWANEKKLTIFANSDIHAPTSYDYDLRGNEHRPMTLVFAKARTAESIKEALIEKRTLAYYGDTLYGNETYLKPFFNASIVIQNPTVEIAKKGRAAILLHNTTDIPIILVRKNELTEINIPKQLVIPAHSIAGLVISAKTEATLGKKEVLLPYQVQNFVVSPSQGLPVDLKVTVNVVQSN